VIRRWPGSIANAALLATTWLFVTALVPTPGQASFDLPPIPEDGHFIQDHANLLEAETMDRVGDVQRIAYEDHDTALVVVTIRSKADHGAGGWGISALAHSWFNRWEIGKTGAEGELHNKGILLLISRDDRRARIELGGDWGRRWDGHARQIMERAIIPEFEIYDYDAGTLAGVEALGEMARIGPDGSIPSRVGSIWDNMDQSPLMTTPLPLWAVLFLGLAGVAALGLAFLLPKNRKVLLITGSTLLGIALLLWVVLVLAALFYGAKAAESGGTGGDAGGGFSAGGGGFGGGGSSGGGGASGGW